MTQLRRGLGPPVAGARMRRRRERVYGNGRGQRRGRFHRRRDTRVLARLKGVKMYYLEVSFREARGAVSIVWRQNINSISDGDFVKALDACANVSGVGARFEV